MCCHMALCRRYYRVFDWRMKRTATSHRQEWRRTSSRQLNRPHRRILLFPRRQPVAIRVSQVARRPLCSSLWAAPPLRSLAHWSRSRYPCEATTRSSPCPLHSHFAVSFCRNTNYSRMKHETRWQSYHFDRIAWCRCGNFAHRITRFLLQFRLVWFLLIFNFI